MDNLDLTRYIEQARKSGMGDNKIREGLLQSGWLVDDINKALMTAPMMVPPEPKPRAMMSKTMAIILAVVAVVIVGYLGGAFYYGGTYYFTHPSELLLWPLDAIVDVPTPLPISGSSNLKETCVLFNDAVFRSSDTQMSNTPPLGITSIYWFITFKNGNFTWEYSDLREQGSYTCSNNVIQASITNKNRVISGQYNSDTGVLIWDGVEYEKYNKTDSADTSTWQTYTNTEYGFEFRYPGDWDNYTVSLDQSDKYYTATYYFCLPTIDDYYKNFADNHCGSKLGYAPVFALSIFSHDQWKIDQQSSVGRSIYIGENSVYVAGYAQAQEPTSDLSRRFNEINQILSTFRFIDKIDTSNWKTYTNTEYGFEFKYPGDAVIGQIQRFTDKSKFNIDVKYDNRVSFQPPGFSIGNGLGAYYNIAPVDTNLFSDKLNSNGQSLIHFIIDNKDIYASCYTFGDVNFDPLLLRFCNQILSMFKFTK